MARVDEAGLNQFNQQLRGDPKYQQYLQSLGVMTDVPEGQAWRLSDAQRQQAQRWVAQNYGMPDAGKGMEIDVSGNANQNEGVGKWAKDWRTYAAIGAGLTGVGALGYGPMAGLFGGTAAAAPAGGALASSSIPTATAMYGPAAIASQGLTGGLGAAGLAGGAAGGGGIIGGLTGQVGQTPWLSSRAAPFSTGPGQVTSQNISQSFGAGSLPSRALGGYDMAANIGVGQGGQQAAAGTSGWRNILDRINSGASDYSTLLGGLGAGLGAGSQAAATNRGEKLGAQMDLEDLLILRDRDYLQRQIMRETEGRAGATDAMQKLQATQRMLSPAERPNVSPYAAPQRQATMDERSGASDLSAEVMKRLRGGNPIPEQVQRELNIDMGLTDPGFWEQLTGYVGPGLQTFGALNQMGGGNNVSVYNPMPDQGYGAGYPSRRQSRRS